MSAFALSVLVAAVRTGSVTFTSASVSVHAMQTLGHTRVSLILYLVAGVALSALASSRCMSVFPVDYGLFAVLRTLGAAVGFDGADH